mmetsp:Transcript_6089/g.17045  ORF Transcript_6089/g.17045 Transcript_6089/m.17045 type:complete len:87 (+) Transcript_6089:118-378(+)
MTEARTLNLSKPFAGNVSLVATEVLSTRTTAWNSRFRGSCQAVCNLVLALEEIYGRYGDVGGDEHGPLKPVRFTILQHVPYNQHGE